MNQRTELKLFAVLLMASLALPVEMIAAEKGGARLAAKVKRYRPKIVAILGVGAYRHAFDQPKAKIGEQPERIHDARVWVLPNPSGLNANYQLPHLVKLFRQLRKAVDAD